MNNKIIKFMNGDLQIDVTVSPNEETVWLNRNQLATLFDRDVKTIGKHINNALKEELDSSTVAKFATVQNFHIGHSYKSCPVLFVTIPSSPVCFLFLWL